MDINPITTERYYRRALMQIERLMDAIRHAGGRRLDALVTLVEAWEAKHYPLEYPPPSP